MRAYIAAMFLAIASTPASALIFTGTSPDGTDNDGYLADGVNPGIIEFYAGFYEPGPLTIRAEVEAGDIGVREFFGIFETYGGFFTAYKFELGGGATWGAPGDVFPFDLGDVTIRFNAPRTTMVVLFAPGETFGAGFGDVFNQGADGGNFELDLSAVRPGDEITLTLNPSVPEPGSWALLIAGFGLTGAAARLRRNGNSSRPATKSI